MKRLHHHHRRRPKSARASSYCRPSSAIPTAAVVWGSLMILMTFVLCYQFFVEKELLLKEYYRNGDNFNYPYGETAAAATTTAATALVPKTTTANHDRNDPPILIKGEDSPPVLMYIHIGKTGGYTLDSVLRSNCEWYALKTAKEDCWALYNSINNQDASPPPRQQQQPFSQGSHLSYYTRSTMHLDPRLHNARWINETTAFLVSARNPIDRAVSAFDMDHILNSELPHRRPKLKQMRQRFYEECFSTAEKLAQGLVATAADTDSARNNNSSMSMSTTSSNRDDDRDDHDPKEEEKQCSSEYARQVLTGTSPYDFLNTHLEYNYQFYRDKTWGDDNHNNKDKAIMVVRTEHLWDDVSNLDRQLGGTGNFTHAAQSHYADHGSSHYLVKSKLSPEGRRLFCRALQEEVAIYRELIERAMNLQEWEKKETLDTLRDDCGGELPSVPKV